LTQGAAVLKWGRLTLWLQKEVSLVLLGE